MNRGPAFNLTPGDLGGDNLAQNDLVKSDLAQNDLAQSDLVKNNVVQGNFPKFQLPPRESRRKPLLLAVDDDPDNLLVLIHVLMRLGYDFITAMDGQSGLDLAIQRQPDLILLDIMLPKLDGYEFVRQLRQHPEISATPTVAVTALARLEDREKISLAGFVDQITKPYLIEEIGVKLSRWLASYSGVWSRECEGIG